MPENALLMQQAISAGRPYPVLSLNDGPPFNLMAAYKVQQALVSGKKIFGFKAGLTTEAGQKRFSLAEPIGGVLLVEPLHYRDAVLSVASEQYNRLMIELELGFVLKMNIDKPVVSIEALKRQVDFVRPVVSANTLNLFSISFDNLRDNIIFLILFVIHVQHRLLFQISKVIN